MRNICLIVNNFITQNLQWKQYLILAVLLHPRKTVGLKALHSLAGQKLKSLFLGLNLNIFITWQLEELFLKFHLHPLHIAVVLVQIFLQICRGRNSRDYFTSKNIIVNNFIAQPLQWKQYLILAVLRHPQKIVGLKALHNLVEHKLK